MSLRKQRKTELIQSKRKRTKEASTMDESTTAQEEGEAPTTFEQKDREIRDMMKNIEALVPPPLSDGPWVGLSTSLT